MTIGLPSIDVPRSPQPRVSVIVPYTSTPALLDACLRSLARHAPRAIPCETIVVLNQAGPEAESALRSMVGGVQVVSSRANLGMAGAGNRGRQLARGELLVTLHDDAEIEPGWLEALVATADAHPEAGAVGGKVLDPDGRLQSAGMILWRDGTTSRPWVGERPPPTAFDRLRAVDYCGSSSLLVRAAVWDAAGGLDERFYPAYYVDVDLAMAVRQLGFAVLYQPKSRIRHRQGASGSPRFRQFLTERHRALFVAKWSQALAEQEPPEVGSAAAVRRALARAASRAASGSGNPPLRAGPVPFDPQLQELELLEAGNAVQRAYANHLAALLEEAENEREVWRQTAEACERRLATRPGAGAYRFGKTLRFRRGGSAFRHRVTGCFPPERWGAWIRGDAAEIVLPLAEHRQVDGDPALRPLTLVLEVVHLLGPGRERSPVRVLVNGELLLEVAEQRGGRQRYAAPIAPAHRAAGRLTVRVEVSAAASPAALGLSADERTLAVGLVSLTVRAAA